MAVLFQSRRYHLLVAAILVLISVVADAQSGTTPLISGLDAIDVTVSDMDHAVAFYSDVLDFTEVSDIEVAGSNYEQLEGVFGVRMRVVRMRLGDEFIVLTEYLAPKGRSIPAGARSNDQSFQHIAIIVSDMDTAYRWLRQNKVEHASSGPQTLPAWNKNAGGISAFYFKDPDGHPLEILHFPPDKGATKWHRSGNQLFLGIDHTAIVVSDTDASVRFYHDLLVMQISGESENYGTRTGAPQQCVRSALENHGIAGNQRSRHRASRIPRSARRTSVSQRRARERCGPPTNRARNRQR